MEEERQEGLLSVDEANALVVEHQGWAESIARSVARAWNLDWRLDGLDGAAMEALIFCSRRFKASFGVPFKGYARKRVHEASTEAAKKSRGWRKQSPQAKQEQQSREISAQLISVYPELREGQLPGGFDEDHSSSGDSGGDQRGAIRQLLIGASLLAAKQISDSPAPDEMLDYKRMVTALMALEPVHQLLLWKVYWEGLSLRTVAADWDTDGLNVIREHKAIVEYLYKHLSLGKQFLTTPKVRPGLKEKASEMKKHGETGPFSEIVTKRGLA